MPATESLRQKINELTAAPAAKKNRKKKSAVSAPRSDKDWTEEEKRSLARAQAAGLGIYDIVVKIDPLCTMPIAARTLIQNAIREVGQVLVVRPDAKSPAASRHVEFIFATLLTEGQIAAKCHIPTITGETTVTLIQAASAKISGTVAEQPAPPAPAIAETTASDAPSGSSHSANTIHTTPPEAQAPATEPSQPWASTENILRVEAGRIDNVLNLSLIHI